MGFVFCPVGMGLLRVFFTEMGGLCFVEMEKTRDLLGECNGGGGAGML